MQNKTMRQNLPVTAQEHPVPVGVSIVSKTDLTGNITYANDAFVSISGYTREELIGQPHNLLRHPDMPEQAFAHPTFVEDVVRNVAQRLSEHGQVEWFSVEVESMESIHNHNAFARIERHMKD